MRRLERSPSLPAAWRSSKPTKPTVARGVPASPRAPRDDSHSSAPQTQPVLQQEPTERRRSDAVHGSCGRNAVRGGRSGSCQAVRPPPPSPPQASLAVRPSSLCPRMRRRSKWRTAAGRADEVLRRQCRPGRLHARAHHRSLWTPGIGHQDLITRSDRWPKPGTHKFQSKIRIHTLTFRPSGLSSKSVSSCGGIRAGG